MRVLHVIPSLASQTGGPAFAVVDSALALRRLGVEATIVASDLASAATGDGGRARLRELPPGAEELDVRLIPARPPRRLAFAPRLGGALAAAARGADVMHFHSLYLFPQLAGYRVARRNALPYVVSPHGALDPWLRPKGRRRKAAADLVWQRAMLEQAAALHATSEGEAQLFADVAPRVRRAVVPLGINWREYQELPPAAAFRGRFLGGHAGPVVLYVGRLSFKKGLDVLIQAFARAAPADALLAIAGPDDEGMRPGLEALAARAGVRSRVVFTGMLHGDDKRAALAAADVWALSSHTENFGLAVVEALAAGCPTLISPAVNIAPEARAAGAVVVSEPRAEEFGRELGAVLGDAARRTALGERAREFARRYDWAEVAPRWKAMYEDAVEDD